MENFLFPYPSLPDKLPSMFFSDLDELIQQKIVDKTILLFREEYHSVVLSFFHTHYPELISDNKGINRFEDIYSMVFLDSVNSISSLIIKLMLMNDEMMKKDDSMSIEINFNVEKISELFVDRYFEILGLELKKHINGFLERISENKE
ncbi:MAG: hypothetical protein JXR95_05355 [Deltaproteobacteria bacterium]|nr:hypothetical protein [Deltaproteobacteria bacterium]